MSEPSDEMSPCPDMLRGLTPRVPSVSRDRLLFEAGRASAAQRWAWLWKAGTLLFAATSIALACALWKWVPHTVYVDRERERIIYLPVSTEPAPARSRPEFPKPKILPQPELRPSPVDPEKIAMWKMRNEVLRWGPDMLPQPHPAPKHDANESKELDRWLGVPLNAFGAPYRTPRLIPRSGKED